MITVTYEARIQKKIDKLTSRVFLVAADDRARILHRIEKLKQHLKDKERIQQTVRIPAEAFRHREKYVL